MSMKTEIKIDSFLQNTYYIQIYTRASIQISGKNETECNKTKEY